MPRSGQIQQFGWISADTAKDFIRLLNEHGAAGFELYSTYKVIDRFMGALMVRWCESAEVVREAMPAPSAQVLRLVPSPEADEDTKLDDADPDHGAEQ